MSRYERPNPIKQKEKEDLLEKVREMTSEGSKGSKGEKLVEEDTDLSWDHEGLRPISNSHKDRIDESPKPPRVPRGPKDKERNEVETVVPQDKMQAPEIGRQNGKDDEKGDFESSRVLADKKTARWIEEQNEFLGEQEEKEFWKNRKERDPSVFEPRGPIKVLQKQRANLHTRYEQVPQYVMGVQKDQAPHPPLVVTNRGDVSWRGQGKRYPLKEKRRTQWGGYGRQYGTGGERKSNQAYGTDGTQT